MRCIEANADAFWLAHIRSDECEMLEPMTDARTLSRCGFEGDLRSHARNFAKHLVDRIDYFLQTSFVACAKVRARMQHQKWQLKLVCTGKLLRESAQRIRMKPRIRRSEIDEIIGVSEHGS